MLRKTQRFENVYELKNAKRFVTGYENETICWILQSYVFITTKRKQIKIF